jgi:hypothetical protein
MISFFQINIHLSQRNQKLNLVVLSMVMLDNEDKNPKKYAINIKVC